MGENKGVDSARSNQTNNGGKWKTVDDDFGNTGTFGKREIK